MGSFTQVNGKVVSAVVAPGREVLAQRGAMLAYSGQVSFAPVHTGPGAGGHGGSMGGMLGRRLAGEAVPLMVAQGQGSVYYGYGGLYVTTVELDGSGPLSVEADRLLAYDANLQSTVVFLGEQGGIRGAIRGKVTGQGLFTTQLLGVGSAALLSHGGTISIQVTPGQTVGVDPQAYVGHLGNLDVKVSASVGWRDAVGRGSGEAIQLKVTGQGTVYVQASEQRF